jgi:hypothetical protein
MLDRMARNGMSVGGGFENLAHGHPGPEEHHLSDSRYVADRHEQRWP